MKWGVKYIVYSELSRITSVVGHCKNTLKGWLAMLTFNWQCEHSELKLEICSRMKYEITVVLFRDCMKRMEILLTLHLLLINKKCILDKILLYCKILASNFEMPITFLLEHHIIICIYLFGKNESTFRKKMPFLLTVPACRFSRPVWPLLGLPNVGACVT